MHDCFADLERVRAGGKRRVDFRIEIYPEGAAVSVVRRRDDEPIHPDLLRRAACCPMVEDEGSEQ